MKNSTKADKIKQLLSKELRTSHTDEAMSPIIRTLIFTHCPQHDEFWENEVPELIKRWMPELTVEITKILNPTVAKWVEA